MRALHRITELAGVCLLLLILAACGSISSASTASTGALKMDAQPTRAASIPSPTATLQTSVQPVRLLVPSIGINAPVESVGTLPDGNMATATRNPWQDVGWYNAGPKPGERGSAVIDGHLDRPGGYPAVFWNLRSIHAGDPIIVVGSDGKQQRFHVTRVAYYTPQDAPLQDIFGNRSGYYLNLITCAGDWIPSQHQTSLRLVIYATL